MLAAVILAAGASSRFGAPKQALLLPAVLERVRESEVEEIVVVLGAHEVEVDALVVHCPDWRSGPGASLRSGLGALSAGIGEAVVVLADGPLLSAQAIARVVAARRAAGVELAAASYAGVRGHPLVLARSGWDRIPDEGLRSRQPLLVPCDDLGAPGDVDTPAELPEGFRSTSAEPM
jgi:CTP:molybdopterin cytidylyltransferase MocA